MPVNAGDVLVITTTSEENKVRVPVNWSQSWSSRSAEYYLLVAENKSQDGKEVTFFVQENWFNDAHLGPKKGDVGREFKIDNKFQYGQKNAEGEGRFVVLHDKERTPYQHRFIETALASGAANIAAKIAKLMNFPSHFSHLGYIFAVSKTPSDISFEFIEHVCTGSTGEHDGIKSTGIWR